MKRVIFICLMISLISLNANAETKKTSKPDIQRDSDSPSALAHNNHRHYFEDSGFVSDQHSTKKFSLYINGRTPKLIKLTKNTTLGLIGGKDAYYTNAKEGWFAGFEINWWGTVLDFSKKEE